MALLLRKDEQAWLLTSDRGHHEFDRIWFMPLPNLAHEGPRYILKAGVAKLGGIELMHCGITDKSAILEWSDGRRSEIPRSYFQMTWRV